MLRRHSLQNIPSRGVKTAATGPERVPGAGGGASQRRSRQVMDAAGRGLAEGGGRGVEAGGLITCIQPQK